MNCAICGSKLSVLRDFGCWSFYCMKCNDFRSESFPNSVDPDNIESKRKCDRCKHDFSALLPKQKYCYYCLDEDKDYIDIDIDEDTTDAEWERFLEILTRWKNENNKRNN